MIDSLKDLDNLSFVLPYDYIKDNQLIVTNNDYNKATVLFDITNDNIRSYFKSSNHKITILPGFVSKSKERTTTTVISQFVVTPVS